MPFADHRSRGLYVVLLKRMHASFERNSATSRRTAAGRAARIVSEDKTPRATPHKRALLTTHSFNEDVSQLRFCGPARLNRFDSRALQERRVTRVGGEREVETNFRLVSATNRDLAELVRVGRFREDLFYRINILQLRVPGLRDRPDDVLWLAHRFVRDIASRLGEPTKLFHPSAEARLATYGWPGNVRELQNGLERACIVCSRNMLFSSDIFEEDGSQAAAALDMDAPLDGYMEARESAFIRAALLQHQGHISEMAHALGISRKSLWEKMRKHAIAAEPLH
jgi:DNA-binding NtrC family response regulator